MGVVLNTCHNMYYLRLLGYTIPFSYFHLKPTNTFCLTIWITTSSFTYKNQKGEKKQLIITIQLVSSGSSPAQLLWLPISTEKGNSISRKERNNSLQLSANFYSESILIFKRPFHPASLLFWKQAQSFTEASRMVFHLLKKIKWFCFTHHSCI